MGQSNGAVDARKLSHRIEVTAEDAVDTAAFGVGAVASRTSFFTRRGAAGRPSRDITVPAQLARAKAI